MKLNSGDSAPKSGTYNVCDKSGKVVNTVRVQKGDRMPPVQQSGWYFEISEK